MAIITFEKLICLAVKMVQLNEVSIAKFLLHLGNDVTFYDRLEFNECE